MINWIHSQGGLMAAVSLIVVILNVLLSAASQILSALHKDRPGALMGAQKVLDWVSANVAHPEPKPADGANSEAK